jgi:hypothetical protein
MKHSESITNLAKALVAAQAELEPVKKDATNPHFKSKYASLDTLIETVRPILLKHGLVILQGGDELTDGITVETTLIHTSGEWVSAAYRLPLDKATPQGAGSAISYGRRYGLSSLLAISTEDDDAEMALPSVMPRAAYDRNAGLQGEPHPLGGMAALKNTARPIEGAVVCEKCGSDMWDNRQKKTNPKAPDFVCKRKNQGCDFVIWPPKGGPVAQTKANTRSVQQALTGDEPPPPDDDDQLPF